MERQLLGVAWACYVLVACSMIYLCYRMLRTRYMSATKCGHMTSMYPKRGVYMQHTTVYSSGGEKRRTIVDVPISGNAPNYCRKCLREKIKEGR